MKKYFYFFAATLAIVSACSKEIVETNENDVETAGKVTLFATLPEFVDVTTRASVSNAGVFSWTEGDKIAVQYYNSQGYPYFVFECTNAATGEFTSQVSIPDGYHLGYNAYYPYDYRGTASDQTFDSPEDAAKGFQMSATISGGQLNFVHDNALMKITVKNIPYFAKQLVVGSAKVALNYSENQSQKTYYVPIKPTSVAAKLKVEVLDGTSDGANAIISKTSGNAVAIDAAAIYPLPDLSINHIIVFTGSNNASHKIGIQGRTYSEGWNEDWGQYDLKSNGSIKYYVMEDKYSNAEALQLQLRQNDGGEYYSKSESVFVVNDVMRTFDVSENSLKADPGYRVYVRFSSAKWSEFRYGSSSSANFVRYKAWWGDNQNSIIGEVSLFPTNYVVYKELPKEYYGYTNYSAAVKKYNDDSVFQQVVNKVVINRDFWAEVQ